LSSVIKFLKYLVSIVLLVFLAFQLDWSAVTTSLVGLHWWALPVAVFLQALAFIVGASRWGALLSAAGVDYGLLRLLRPYFIGSFFNNVLPSSAGGDVFRIYHIHTRQHGAAASFSPVLTERIIGLATLLIIAASVSPFYPSDNPLITGLAYTTQVILAGLLVFLAMLGSPPTYRPIHRYFEQWQHIKSVSHILNISEAVHQCLKNPRLLSRVFLLSAIAQFLVVIAFWALGKGIGLDAPLVSFVFVVPLILVAAGLPFAIGGYGVREAAAIALLAASGVDQADGGAIAILYVAVLLLASMPGLFLFVLCPVRNCGDNPLADDTPMSRESK
jgi:hypothetical protein